MSRAAMLGAMVAGFLAFPNTTVVEQAIAQESGPRSWSEIKCARYKTAWAQALAIWDPKGIGADFIDRHEAFLASGCTAKAEVCPKSPEEFALANAMIVAAMNAGAASTFPPFACRD